MDVKWFEASELASAPMDFQKKYDAKSFDGVADAELFYKALVGAFLESKDSDDDDKAEMYEDLEIDIEEFDSLAYFIEIRGTEKKFVMKLTEEESALGMYTGKWENLSQKQLMEGDPNTDKQFFNGDLKVEGSLKLASKPRDWIYAFFNFIDREVD